MDQKLLTFINLVPSVVTMYLDNPNKENIDCEVLMIAKIRTSLSKLIMDKLHNLHPYDLPEIYVIPVIYQIYCIV